MYTPNTGRTHHSKQTANSGLNALHQQRAIQRSRRTGGGAHDVSMTAMLLYLGLRERIVGYTGFTCNKHRDPWIDQALDGVPQLASRYPFGIETLLATDTQLFFAGWNYGMHVGGPATPVTLAPFGIAVELSESCSWSCRSRVPVLRMYRDLDNLGRIFSVEPRACALEAQMRERIATVRAAVAHKSQRPRVLLYDSGEDRPTTSGRLGMPQALIDAAGGNNVMEDVNASWTQVNWERWWSATRK